MRIIGNPIIEMAITSSFLVLIGNSYASAETPQLSEYWFGQGVMKAVNKSDSSFSRIGLKFVPDQTISTQKVGPFIGVDFTVSKDGTSSLPLKTHCGVATWFKETDVDGQDHFNVRLDNCGPLKFPNGRNALEQTFKPAWASGWYYWAYAPETYAETELIVPD